MSSPPAEPLSPGQKMALESIRTTARLSRGALTLDDAHEQSFNGVFMVRVWLSSASLPPAKPGGLQLRPWEPIDIQIPADFPDQSPIASAGHNDFASLPHVTEGSGFCLRIWADNWSPNLGMTGFLQQVIATYGHISLGTLEGHLLPWHPPPASPEAGCVVIRSDLPETHRASAAPTMLWAAGVQTTVQRIDIVGWPDFSSVMENTEELAANDSERILSELKGFGEKAFLVPVLAMSRPTAFEYGYFLFKLLRRVLEPEDAIGLFNNILLASSFNMELDQEKDPGNSTTPYLFLLRAPADTRLSGSDPGAHFAAGILAASETQMTEALFSGDEAERQQAGLALLGAPIHWAQVHDSRPEVILRRGAGRPTGKLTGTRVLVLGCGALGAQIAEHCVRAGAARVHLVDSDTVSPGILVRQPYQDADIGNPKAEVLAQRLDQIRPGTEVSATAADVISLDLPGVPELGQPDLIIDATASSVVATDIERKRGSTPDSWPALITVGLSQTATAGIAAVTPRGFTGAGVDLLRKLGLATSQDPDFTDILDEFFPLPEDRTLFHPEPGCSDATFTGSSTDVSALAAQLLDSGLARLDSLPTGSPAPAPPGPVAASLCIARLGRDGGRKPARAMVDIRPDLLLADNRDSYQVRLDPRAAERMRHIITAAAADPSPADEFHVGGLLLGQFDDACQIVWVSEVTSPPGGSSSGAFGLELNTPQALKYLEARREQSRGLLSHIGFWHVHHGSPEPSETDRQTMQHLLGYVPRMLLLILGLPDQPLNPDSPVRPGLLPDMHAEVFTAWH